MSRRRPGDVRGLGGFPRVSGDEPNSNGLVYHPLWFSPRERG